MHKNHNAMFMINVHCEVRLKFLKKMIILGPKTAILGPQFCRILVLGPHLWWSGGGSAPALYYFKYIRGINVYSAHFISSQEFFFVTHKIERVLLKYIFNIQE